MTDEKGYSPRHSTITQGVCPDFLKSRAKSAEPAVDWNHITVASFTPLAGPPLLPPGVVVDRKGIHAGMQALWPEAVFEHSDSGSVTAEIFAVFLLKCVVYPMRDRAVKYNLYASLLIVAVGVGCT
jgi:hypothetical protein